MFIYKHLTVITVTRYIEKKVSLRLLCGVQHSVIMAEFIMPETQQPISYYFDYLLSLPFKGPCRTLGIYFR